MPDSIPLPYIVLGFFVTLAMGILSSWMYDVLRRVGILPETISKKVVLTLVLITAVLLFLTLAPYRCEYLPSLCQPSTFTVQADRGWQSTGISVTEGDQIDITYISGQWTVNRNNIDGIDPLVDADGYRDEDGNLRTRLLNPPLKDASDGALIGRIGVGGPFLVSKAVAITALEDGMLQLRINDEDYISDEYAGTDDNEGSVEVQITVLK